MCEEEEINGNTPRYFVALALLPELAHWPCLAYMFEGPPWHLERHLRAAHGSEALQMG